MSTLTRIARTAAGQIEHTFLDGETGVDAVGTVTVTGTDANGVASFSGNATGAGSGRYTFAVPAQSLLQLHDVAWAGTVGGAARVETDQVEIVGGFAFTLVQGRAVDEQLRSTTKYPTSALLTARLQTEQELEWICDQAWVPRYGRLLADGTGTTDLLIPAGGDVMRGGVLLRGVRTVRAARIAPRMGQPFVDLTAPQLAALAMRPDGSLRRTDGGVWTEGVQNVIVEYEYGSDRAPEDLVFAALQRFRSRANLTKSGVPDRAITFTVPDQGTYRLSLPDAYRTGIPDIDGVYARYSRRVQAADADGARRPASRTLTLNPQAYSLFHRSNQ